MKQNKINKSYVLQVLKEVYDASEDKKLGVSFRKYVELIYGSDPGFFHWLFADDDADDFESLSDEQKEEYKDFLNNWCE